MTNDRMVKKLCEWKRITTGLAGRQETGWENDIKEGIGIMKINDWTKILQNGVKWKEMTEKTKTFKQRICSSWRRRRYLQFMFLWNISLYYVSSKTVSVLFVIRVILCLCVWCLLSWMLPAGTHTAWPLCRGYCVISYRQILFQRRWWGISLWDLVAPLLYNFADEIILTLSLLLNNACSYTRTVGFI